MVHGVKLKLVKEEHVSYGEPTQIREARTAAEFAERYIDGSDREMCIALLLDSKNRVTAIHTISIGSLNASIVHPREVFKAAIVANASAIVLAHNHPSGDTTPSREDIELTKRMKEAADILGIRLLDHIIIGNGYYSFADRGEM